MLAAHVNCKKVNFWLGFQKKGKKIPRFFKGYFLQLKFTQNKFKLEKFNSPKQTHIWVVPLKMSHLNFTRPIQLTKIIRYIYIYIYLLGSKDFKFQQY